MVSAHFRTNRPCRQGLISNLVDTSIRYATPKIRLTVGHALLNSSPFPGLGLIELFMRVSRQTAQGIDLKLSGCIHYSTHWAWLTFDHKLMGTLCWIPTVFWPLIDWAVSAYSQTNGWSDWAQISWANSLGAWLTFGQFPSIFSQTADWI